MYSNCIRIVSIPQEELVVDRQPPTYRLAQIVVIPRKNSYIKVQVQVQYSLMHITANSLTISITDLIF